MSTTVAPAGLVDRFRHEVGLANNRVRNGFRLAAGADEPDVGQTPRDLVWSCGRTRLWRYRNDDVRMSTPLLITFSLFSRSYILDLRPGNSFVEQLVAAGFDVFLLDWGVPDERDADNRLEDYVDGYLPAAVEHVRRASGADRVDLLGYCFGGVLALLYAAHHTGAPLRSLTVLTTPADLQQMPLTDTLAGGSRDVDAVLDEDGNVPASTILQGFRTLRPTAEVTTYVDLWVNLADDDYVTAHRTMRGWATDHVPLPGGVARQLAQLSASNAIARDRLTLGGERVRLADLRVPFLHVLGTRDHIVPEAAAAPLIDLVGSPDKHELRLDAGHVGLLVGRTAAATTVPTIIEFLRQRNVVAA